MRRKNVHKPKRMKRTSRRSERKAVTLAPLPRPAERHDPVVKYERIWP